MTHPLKEHPLWRTVAAMTTDADLHAISRLDYGMGAAAALARLLQIQRSDAQAFPLDMSVIDQLVLCCFQDTSSELSRDEQIAADRQGLFCALAILVDASGPSCRVYGLRPALPMVLEILRRSFPDQMPSLIGFFDDLLLVLHDEYADERAIIPLAKGVAALRCRPPDRIAALDGLREAWSWSCQVRREQPGLHRLERPWDLVLRPAWAERARWRPWTEWALTEARQLGWTGVEGALLRLRDPMAYHEGPNPDDHH